MRIFLILTPPYPSLTRWLPGLRQWRISLLSSPEVRIPVDLRVPGQGFAGGSLQGPLQSVYIYVLDVLTLWN